MQMGNPGRNHEEGKKGKRKEEKIITKTHDIATEARVEFMGGKRKKERKKTITKIHDLANETRVEIVEAGCGCDALHG